MIRLDLPGTPILLADIPNRTQCQASKLKIRASVPPLTGHCFTWEHLSFYSRRRLAAYSTCGTWTIHVYMGYCCYRCCTSRVGTGDWGSEMMGWVNTLSMSPERSPTTMMNYKYDPKYVLDPYHPIFIFPVSCFSRSPQACFNGPRLDHHEAHYHRFFHSLRCSHGKPARRHLALSSRRKGLDGSCCHTAAMHRRVAVLWLGFARRRTRVGPVRPPILPL